MENDYFDAQDDFDGFEYDLEEEVDEERSFKLESVHVGGFKLGSNSKRSTAWNEERQRLTTMQWLVENAAATLSLSSLSIAYEFKKMIVDEHDVVATLRFIDAGKSYYGVNQKDLEGKTEEISKSVYNYDKVDKVIFAVNSSFLAVGFSLVNGIARILSDKPPADGEVIGINGCNEPQVGVTSRGGFLWNC
ncbi:hypothetical protein ZIOFF_007715 [Zingiber officinale]|uniref:Uncharacterized protein n=1 Tax=Zingiber officinale TaxID=94328 RepID=A0A8J5HXM3_ZINOF|nr:hypothetical protein ZIOFF_007715 [Zingiber officinale]